MVKLIEMSLPPEIAFVEDEFEKYIHQEYLKKEYSSFHYKTIRRSIDARGRQVKINIAVELYIDEVVPVSYDVFVNYKYVKDAPSAIVVGAGPAGLFAALRLIELGIKPIVIERGKGVRARRRDLAAINKEHFVNPDSNYCFGEGGAGTYSDGKLYTRSKKRGDLRKVLEVFVGHGATKDILVDAHPHIGTNKLPGIVTALRETIIKFGGEVIFDSRVVDIIIRNNEAKGVITQSGDQIEGMGVILATGHSARDIFYMLHRKNILIESKPYALGVRIEHQQSLIDSIQYHCESRSAYLPASSYSLVTQVKYKGVEKGVFSFCMCPGGFIVPSATAPGEVVVNGMSPSRRDSKFANSGMVVEVHAIDLKPFQKFGPLAGLEFQKSVEQQAWLAGGKTQVAPAQLMLDFVNKKSSNSLLETSYQPGLAAVEMRDVLPENIAEYLKEGFKAFGQKMRGYLTNDAQIIGVESRTSSPVKIPRDNQTYEHLQIGSLYPCGEGAGYAGGIVSAAMDGERCAEQLALKISRKL
jgi:uncharacterized protein